MAPQALASPDTLQTVSQLNQNGVKHALEDTAPSVLHNGSSTDLQELDAIKLSYTYAKGSRQVPEPDSPEVWSQSV